MGSIPVGVSEKRNKKTSNKQMTSKTGTSHGLELGEELASIYTLLCPFSRETSNRVIEQLQIIRFTRSTNRFATLFH